MRKLFKKKKMWYELRSLAKCVLTFLSVFLIHLNTTALLGTHFSLWFEKLEGSKGVRMSSLGHERTE